MPPSPTTTDTDENTAHTGTQTSSTSSATAEPTNTAQTQSTTSTSAGATSVNEPGETSSAGSSAASTSPDETSAPNPECRGARAGERAAPLVLSGNTFAHDPTMIDVNGTLLRYWTGDNVPSATSNDLLNWTNAPSVYGPQYPSWVTDWKAQNPGNTFNFPWAPDISKFGGKYHLYVSFSAFFGRNRSCITHLSADDPLDGKWTDHGPVICSTEKDPFNAIDADVGLDADGNPWLAFGSFWDGIFAFPLSHDGERQGDELVHLAWSQQIEAPVLFHRCGYYYLFVSWGLCCPGEGRSIEDLTYRVAVGRATDIKGPYVDKAGVPLLDGGGTIIVEGDKTRYAAAGHSDVVTWNGRMYHLYHAYRQSDGGAELRIVELPFDDEGWPIGGPP